MKKKKRSFMFCFIVIYFLLTLDVQVNSWNSETLEVLGNGEKYYSNTAEQLGNGNVVDIYRTINYSSSQKPDYIWENATDIVDVDGDGKLDILLGSRIYRNNYTTQELLGFSQKMLQNTSLNTAGAVVRIEISNGFVASVGYGDLNGDGMLDIVYIVRNGTTGMGYVGVFYINTTLWQSGGNVSSHNTRWIYIGNTTFANTWVRVVDVDGDGSNELLFLNYSTIYVFDQRTLEMEKNHTLSEARVIIVGNNALRTVQLLDVDGDDDDDLLVGETNGVHIFRKETLIAGGKINVSEGELFVPGAVLPFYLAEVTQRGRTNLLIKKSYGESTIAVYILENGLSFSGNPVVNLDSIPHKKVLIGAHLNTLTISDVNNDDYDDLLFSMNSLGAGGKADVYLLLGGENLPSTVQGEFDGIFPGFRPAVSDFDGNGLKEVLLAQPYYQTGDTTGAIIGYEIIGTPPYDFSESLHYHVMITGTPEFCERDYGYPWVYQVMDLNKDGVDDLVVRCIGRVPALHVFLGRRPEPPQIVRVGDLSPVYRGETFKINIWVRDVHNPLFSMRAETEVGREGNWTEIRILSTRVKWDLENVSNSSLELKILVPQNMEPGRWDFRIRVFNTYNLSSDWYYMNGSLEVLDYDPVVYDFEIYPERLYVWEDMTISGQVWDRDDGLGNLSISLEIWNGSYGLGGRWEEVDGFEYEIRDEYGGFEGLWKPERYGVGRHVLRLKVEDIWGGVGYSGNRSYYGEALPPEVRVGSGRYEVYRGDELRVPVEVVHEYLEVEVRVWIRNGSEVVEGGWDEVVEEAIVGVPLNVSAGVYDLVVEVYSEMGNVSEEAEGIVDVLNNLPVMDIPEKLRFEIGRERYELSGRGWDREDGYNVSWEVEVLSGPLRVVEEGEGYVEFESEEIGAGKILFRVMDRDGGLYEREVNYTVMPEGVGGVGYNLTVLVKGAGGEAVGGARVVLVGGGVRLDKVCGGDGVVVFEGLSEGWYEVRVYPPEGSGYRDWEGREYVDGDKILEVNLEVEGVVGGGGVIRGMVVSGGEPIEGVRVVLIGPVEGENRTGEDGVFRFEGLPAGNYTVRFEMEGYRGVEVKVVLEEGEEKNLGMIEMEREGEVGVSRGAEEWVWKAILLAVVIMAALTVFYFRRRGLSGMEE